MKLEKISIAAKCCKSEANVKNYTTPGNTRKLKRESMHTNGNQCRTIKVAAHQCGSVQTNGNQCEPMKTNATQWKPMHINGNQCRRMEIIANQWESMKVNGELMEVNPNS